MGNSINLQVAEEIIRKFFDLTELQRILREGRELTLDLQPPLCTLFLTTVIYYAAVAIYETHFVWWRHPPNKKIPGRKNFFRSWKIQEYKNQQERQKREHIRAIKDSFEIQRSKKEWMENVTLKNTNRREWLIRELRNVK